MISVGDEIEGLAHSVIGAAIEVHRVLGPGFVEVVYEEALCSELVMRGIPFARQATIMVTYKDRVVGECRLDMLVAGKLVVELKSVEALLPVHKAQVVSYLKVTDSKLGLLINFNVPYVKDGIKRVILK
jgi:GxxExxY protein